MKMTSQEQLQDVLHRRKRMIAERQRRRTGALAAVTAVLTVLLFVSVRLTVRSGALQDNYSAFGSFLLFPEAGGVLLAALVAFVAGVVITALVLRNGRKNKEENTGEMRDG